MIFYSDHGSAANDNTVVDTNNDKDDNTVNTVANNSNSNRSVTECQIS